MKNGTNWFPCIICASYGKNSALASACYRGEVFTSKAWWHLKSQDQSFLCLRYGNLLSLKLLVPVYPDSWLCHLASSPQIVFWIWNWALIFVSLFWNCILLKVLVCVSFFFFASLFSLFSSTFLVTNKTITQILCTCL